MVCLKKRERVRWSSKLGDFDLVVASMRRERREGGEEGKWSLKVGDETFVCCVCEDKEERCKKNMRSNNSERE